MTDLPPPEPPGMPPFTRALLLCVVVFVAFVGVGSPVQALNLPFGAWFTELVVFFGVAAVLLRSVGVDPVRGAGLDATRPSALGFGVALGLVNYLAWAIPLMTVAQETLPQGLLDAADASRLFEHQTPLERVVFVAALGLAAPVCEEFFFRGVVQPGLMTRLPPARAIVVSALLFSAFHVDLVGFLARFELGVLFGLLAWRSGSVWPGIAAHAANNLLATALFLLDAGAEDAPVPWGLVAALVVAGNAGLLVLARLASGRLRGPRPAEERRLPPVPLWRGALWLTLPAVTSVSLFLALDWRGAMIRAAETMHPLPPRTSTPPELEALRAQARRGEVPVADYLEARSLLGPGDTGPARGHRKE